MVRGEMNKRLYGALSAEEREARLGTYFEVRWGGLTGQEPVRVELHYRQAATGARILRKEQSREASEEGNLTFKIVGKEFQEGGRVLAWKVNLFEGRDLIGSQQSYLWQ